MNELRRIFRHQLLPALGLVAAGCLVHFQVAAQVADPAFERFRSQVVGNTVNYSYGGNGTPLGGAGNATGIGVSAGVDVSRPTRVATKHGPINGTLIQKISQGAMGSAFARAAGTVLGPVGLAFLAVPVIVDWMTDAGIVHNDDGFQKPEDRHPSVEDNYENQGHSTMPWRLDGTQACLDYLQATGIAAAYNIGTVNFTAPSTCSMTIQPKSPPGEPYAPFGVSVSSRTRTVPVPPLGFEDASNAEVQASMSSVNPGPAALAELYKLGETLDLANPIPDLVDTLRAEFEARSPESVTTETTESPAETKTEEKTCATYTQVVGGVLSLVEQCETTTTTQAKDPLTGEPVGSPTTTTTTSSSSTPDPKAEESEEAEGLCKLFPDIAACAKLGTATETIPTSSQSVSYTPESVFGAGTCPADKTFVAYGQTLQLTNMAQACDLLDTYVKPIAILLAAFTALMIVAVGLPE